MNSATNLASRMFSNSRSGENATQRTDRSHRMKGRPLFGEQFNSETIDRMIELGARAKRTQLTEKFTLCRIQSASMARTCCRCSCWMPTEN